VLGLPRGGVPVGRSGQTFGSAVGYFFGAQTGSAGQEELAMGAIATGGVTFLTRSHCRTRDIAKRPGSNDRARTGGVAPAGKAYRPSERAISLHGRLVILVDDGLATGATMRAGCAVREKQPSRTLVVVPVASRDTYEQFQTWPTKLSVCKRRRSFAEWPMV